MTAEILLALTIFYEARGEPFEGKAAVAQVVMNRVKDKRWPDTIEDVILQPKQFSCWNSRKPVEPRWFSQVFAACLETARMATAGKLPEAKWNHYYNPDLCTPSWAADGVKIGNHVFMEL